MHVFIDFDDSCLVSTSVTVIRSREKSEDIVFMSRLDSLHDKLMSSGNLLEIISVVELDGVVLTEGEACPSLRNIEAQPVIRVTPQQVTHRPIMRHFLHSVQLPNLI
jgi:hypothetical protein